MALGDAINGEDEALELDPTGTYRVTVQIEAEELASASSLPELAKLLSARVRARGLTPQRLADILDGGYRGLVSSNILPSRRYWSSYK